MYYFGAVLLVCRRGFKCLNLNSAGVRVMFFGLNLSLIMHKQILADTICIERHTGWGAIRKKHP